MCAQGFKDNHKCIIEAFLSVDGVISGGGREGGGEGRCDTRLSAVQYTGKLNLISIQTKIKALISCTVL